MMNSASLSVFSGKCTLPSLHPSAPASTEAGSVDPVREREVHRLVGEEDGAAGEMAVHHRLLARAVGHAQEPRDIVLERDAVVLRICGHGVWIRIGAALRHERGRGDTEKNTKNQTNHQVAHFDLLTQRIRTGQLAQSHIEDR